MSSSTNSLPRYTLVRKTVRLKQLAVRPKPSRWLTQFTQRNLLLAAGIAVAWLTLVAKLPSSESDRRRLPNREYLDPRDSRYQWKQVWFQLPGINSAKCCPTKSNTNSREGCGMLYEVGYGRCDCRLGCDRMPIYWCDTCRGTGQSPRPFCPHCHSGSNMTWIFPDLQGKIRILKTRVAINILLEDGVVGKGYTIWDGKGKSSWGKGRSKYARGVIQKYDTGRDKPAFVKWAQIYNEKNKTYEDPPVPESWTNVQVCAYYNPKLRYIGYDPLSY